MTSEPKDKDLPSLVELLLRAADDFKLSQEQFVALTRLHFGRNSNLSLDAVESILSASQLRKAVTVALSNEAATSSDEPQAHSSDTAIASTAVELDLASRVAERLVKWSKIFGFFVAAPVTLLLIMLSFFGISKFSDVQSVADRANVALAKAQDRLSSVSSKERGVDRQLAYLQSASQSAAQKICQLNTRTDSLEHQLGKTSAEFSSGSQGDNPGFISSIVPNPGPLDKAYGPWGIPANAVEGMVSDPAFPWRLQFTNVAPGSGAFDSAWRQVAQSNSTQFWEVQRAFIQRKWSDPAFAAIRAIESLDLSKRSPGLQEAVIQWAEMAGPGEVVFHKAAQNLRVSGKWNLSSPSFDDQLLDEYLKQLQYTPYFGAHPRNFVHFREGVLMAKLLRPAPGPPC